MEVQLYPCATSALHGSGWPTPRPGRFIPLEATRYPLYKRQSGPQDRSWRERWRAYLLHSLGFKHRTVQLVATRFPISKVATVRDNYHKWSSGEDVSNDTSIRTNISTKIYSLQVTADYVRMKAGNSAWQDCSEEKVLRWNKKVTCLRHASVSVTQIQQHTYDRPVCPLHRDSSIHMIGRCVRYTERAAYTWQAGVSVTQSSTHMTYWCNLIRNARMSNFKIIFGFCYFKIKGQNHALSSRDVHQSG